MQGYASITRTGYTTVVKIRTASPRNTNETQ